MATMLALITLVVKKSGGEMPVYAAADKVGLKYAAGAVILLSVFTTMVSALETAAEIIVPDEKRKPRASFSSRFCRFRFRRCSLLRISSIIIIPSCREWAYLS